MFLIALVLVIGVLIFVHELGHFAVARRNGVKAPEFGFGFPPRIVGIQFLRKKSDQDAAEKKAYFKRWRLIWGKKDGDDEEEQSDLVRIGEEDLIGGTIYSLNWIPLGGFVRIKGENGACKDDVDSFASKGGWTRIKILAAGVTMNFLFAWLLLSISFMIGAPVDISEVETGTKSINSKIQVSEVAKGAPAEAAGLVVGDEILQRQMTPLGEEIVLKDIKTTQDYINANKGKELELKILRGKKELEVKITPRESVPEGEGAIGIGLTQTALVSYPWYESIGKGAVATWDIFTMIILGIYGLLKGFLAGNGSAADVSGPVGIAMLTRDVLDLGWVYLIQFTAILSINLGIINALPIPALDGGRILFILIEKLKGSPISQKVEQSFHAVFFALLILLMILVTYKDIAKFF